MATVREPATLEGAFGEALRHLREAQGLSQEELADRCHIHRTYVSQLERGLKSPTLRLVWQICDSLSADPVNVLTNTAAILGRQETVP